MTERPILFSSAMVRAILAGAKTQTRRVISPQPRADVGDSFVWHGGKALLRAGYGAMYVHTSRDACARAMLKTCPYGQPGDALWVRETWTRYHDGSIGFRADLGKAAAEKIRWRQSLFLKRADARLFLRVLAVRVACVQDISEADAEAEGVEPRVGAGQIARYVASFRDLWDSLNGGHGRGFPWRSNPWVWVITFERLLQ